MKIFACILPVLIVSILLFSACKAPTDSTTPEQPPSHPLVSQSEKPSSPSEKNISDSSSASPSSSSGTKTEKVESSVTGTISSVATGHIYLLLEDDQLLVFEYTNANTSGWKNSLPGSKITIYYTGELNGNDTSGVRVTKVEDAK